MGVKKNSQRIFILVIVVAFLLSSIGFTGLVIYESFVKKDSAANSTAEIQKQLEEQAKNQNKEGKLEGTKLADFTPVDPVTELKIIDIKPGTGAEVKQGGTVTAHYTGALAKDGTIFQSSKDSGQQFTSSLGGVIPGWQQGIPGMKVGGIRRIIIPAELAYGDKAQGNIPANSALVFDIELSDTK